MRRIKELEFTLGADCPENRGPDWMARIGASAARAMAGMYHMPEIGSEMIVAYTKINGVSSRMLLANISGDWYLYSDTVKVADWPAVFRVEIIRHKPPELRCPECGQPVHHTPVGSAMPKCWNSDGHKSGRPVVFDTMPD